MRHVYLLGALVISGAAAAACGDANTSQLAGGGTGVGGGSSSGTSGTVDGTSSGASGSGGSSSGGSSSGGSSSGGSSSGGSSSGGSSSGGSSSGSPPPPPPPGACISPAVQTILNTQCVACHSDPPVNGSLSGLVTFADLSATSKEDPSKNEAQESLAKLQAGLMPPGSSAASNAAAISAFQTWISGNYQVGCGQDAGVPPPPPDPFGGAPPYVPGSPGGDSSHNPGQDCMGHHNHGFTWAGTLTDTNGNAIAKAEVRLLDANGVATSVYTDSLGNFHSGKSWASPAYVGARNATNKALMAQAITKGGCNSCHANGGVQAPIHLP
jgi:hypothetical protein